MTKENLKSQPGDKKEFYRKILIGSIAATVVGATPFLFYLYEYVPSTEKWDTILGTYHSKQYGDANVAMWVFSMKIIPLVLSLVWFFTCRHWWYHVLIIPITMFSFQCIGALNDDVRFMDEFHILYLLPIMAIIFPSIYLIRAQMFNKINNVDKTLEELEEEFMIKPKGVWGKVKQYF
ncbi:hypothetical protein GCM10008085_14020 [Winogradskyella epiphytica]|uniref:hypothetical protein n=1 Tax=Winogradskyella epiphytica TaxID=262005 RepID=UPI0019C92262|nr:hypothetical protein [Winogradskyella epiphytica]GGW63339.1 hypothetical protein GCM10008085_14020 [Winogradskyella epiphytica]